MYRNAACACTEMWPGARELLPRERQPAALLVPKQARLVMPNVNELGSSGCRTRFAASLEAGRGYSTSCRESQEGELQLGELGERRRLLARKTVASVRSVRQLNTRESVPALGLRASASKRGRATHAPKAAGMSLACSMACAQEKPSQCRYRAQDVAGQQERTMFLRERASKGQRLAFSSRERARR